MDDSSQDLIMISAITHFSYCKRRYALVHINQSFEENIHTQRGNDEHERVDIEHARHISPSIRVEFALPVWSDRLALIGKCDVVEFHKNGAIYPVEYKHGKKKKHQHDELQLTAQVICLEEMTGKSISHGAIYHISSNKRREVEISLLLRKKLENTLDSIRELLKSKRLPPPIHDSRCKECSLRNICQPDINSSRISQLSKTLFEDVEL